MPEIVEVKTDADLLDFYLSNRQLESISFITDLFKNKSKGLEELNECLPLTVNKVVSRAKKLFFHLVDPNPDSDSKKADWWIFLTYGMSGRISVNNRKHSHIKFNMSHNWIGFDEFYYSNVRRIGYFEASDDPDVYQHHINDMGKPAVLGWDFDGFEPITKDEFTANIKKTGITYLAKAIDDQRSILSGIGNYLLSECFHEAKLEPFVKCRDMTDEKIERLYKAIEKVIKESYEHGGVSMTDYVHIDNTLGEHEHHLKVYGKNKEYIDGKEIRTCKGAHGRTMWYVDHE